MDRCKKALGNGGKISSQQKIITFQGYSDICLVCDKRFAVISFTVQKLENKDVAVAATTNGMQQLSN